MEGSREIPDFILIQDVHRRPEVQEHIAALIEYAHQAWGMQEVLIEGAFGPVDLSGYEKGTFDRARLSAWIQQGVLSGSEMAALAIHHSGDQDFRLTGIEAPFLYRANLKAYQDVQTVRAAALRELSSMPLLSAFPGFPTNLSDRIERLIRLKLTPSDFKAGQSDPIESVASPVIAQAVRMASIFYEIADLRTAAFLEHLLETQDPVCRVVVVGGFHAEGMADVLRQAHRSFVVLAPQINEAGDDRVYNDRLAQTLNALDIP